MKDIVKNTEELIKGKILSAAAAATGSGEFLAAELPDFIIEIPADRKFGDYSVNAAMVWAKLLRLPPRKIAETLLSHISADDIIGSFEIAGAGFINIRLTGKFYSDAVTAVLEAKEAYGNSDFGGGKSVMVEFVSANPTGPMHIGNARGGALGDCLASVLNAAGFKSYKEFYVNDAGNQIEKFGVSLEARYLQRYLGEDKVEFPEDGYHGEDIKQSAAEFAEVYGNEYVQKSSDERKAALIEFVLPRNVEALRNDLLQYNISYDNWFLESSLHSSGAVSEMMELMKSKDLTYMKDGALWYKAIAHGGEKDEVLIRANGHPTYFAADIAYHYNKLVTREFDRCINIWGADHHGHVARLKGVLDAIGISSSRLDIVLMQLVRLVRGDEVVKVSKRTGKSLTLRSLLDEVPIDAARFFFNLREPNTHLEFDLDLAVEEDSKNPVYYVQYAHARICSILRNLAQENILHDDGVPGDLSLLAAPEEQELIRYIAALPGEIVSSAKQMDPSRMTKYAINLATLFHRFYNACRVKNEDNIPLTKARLALCVATKTTLFNVLSLLGVTAPEYM